jgi:hypothetical protein
LPSIRIAAGLIVDHAGRVLLVRKRGTTTFDDVQNLSHN